MNEQQRSSTVVLDKLLDWLQSRFGQLVGGFLAGAIVVVVAVVSTYLIGTTDWITEVSGS